MRELTTTSHLDFSGTPEGEGATLQPVRDGVWCIPLPLPVGDGLLANSICYVLEGSDGPRLVDAGWDSDSNLDRLARALGDHGWSLADIRGVTATHAHPDHIALGARLQREHGVPLAAHRREVAASAFDPDALRQRAERWGMPHEVAEQISASLRSRPSRVVAPDVLLDDGDVLDIPGRRVEVVWTPGHTAGSICLRDAHAGLLFTGDHVLPQINPGLGLGGFDDDDDFVAAALDSYARMPDFDEDEVAPGHGDRFVGLAMRAGELAARHRARGEEIAEIVRRAPSASVWEVASQVSWTAGWTNLRSPLRISALRQTEMHVRRALA